MSRPEQLLNLQAAVKHRRFADVKAERIFKRVLNETYKTPSLPPLSFLDPHQIEGVKWILSRKRSYLAHAPGAGKTAQVIIASILTEGTGRTLFIVPPGLTENWKREIKKFSQYGDFTYQVSIIGASSDRDSVNWFADFIICPDSMLAKPWVLENLHNEFHPPFNFIAVDEASRFKESTSIRSIALFGGMFKDGLLSKGLLYKAKHVVLMDGSPMPNRPMELWGPTYALDPEAIDCMGQYEFGFEYCGARMNPFGKWEFKFSSNESKHSLSLKMSSSEKSRK
jgi:hypothetical protein